MMHKKRLLISGKLDENCFEAAISRQNYPLLTLIFFYEQKKTNEMFTDC